MADNDLIIRLKLDGAGEATSAITHFANDGKAAVGDFAKSFSGLETKLTDVAGALTGVAKQFNQIAIGLENFGKTRTDAAEPFKQVASAIQDLKPELDALGEANKKALDLPVDRSQSQITSLGDTSKSVLGTISDAVASTAKQFENLAVSIGGVRIALAGIAVTALSFANTLKNSVVDFSGESLAEKLQKNFVINDDLKKSIEAVGQATRDAIRDFQDEDGALTDLQRELLIATRAFNEMKSELGTVGPKALTGIEKLTGALTELGVKPEVIHQAFVGLARGIESELDRIRVATLAGNAQLIKDALNLQQLERSQTQSRLSVQGAELSLRQAQAKLAITRGSAADPELQKRLTLEQEILAVEEAELRVKQAKIAQEQAAENVTAARRKSAEDAANALPAVTKLVTNLIAGVNVIGPKVNETAENLARGFTASLGPTERYKKQLESLTGSAEDLDRNAPNVVPIFNKLADLFKATGDSALNARVATILFGGAISEDLLKALSKGSEGLRNARDLKKSITDLNKDFSIRNLEDFSAQLLKIKDPAERAKKAVEILGETFGKVLIDSLSKGGSIAEAVAPLSGIVNTFDSNIRTSNNFKESLDNLKKALLEVGAASNRSNLDLGLLIAPAVTPIINAAAEGIKKLNVDLRKVAADIGGAIKSVVNDIFTLLAAGGKQVNSSGLTSLGKVVNEVIIPAFSSLISIAKQASEIISQALGFNVSPLLVSVGSVLPFLIGGFNTLGIAILALFGPSVTAGMTKFKEGLKGVGIDIDGIKDSIQGVINDIQTLFAAKGEKVESSELGSSIGKGVNEIAIPAVTNLVKVINELAKAVNEILGTNISPALLALGAALPFLIGGFNSLIVAAVALFSALSAGGFEQFKEGLKTLKEDIVGLVGTIQSNAVSVISDFWKVLTGKATEVTENKWIVELKNTLVDFFKSIPTAAKELAGLFVTLSAIVGPGRVAKFVFLEMSGALTLLRNVLLPIASAAVIVSASLTAMVTAITLVGSVFALSAGAAALWIAGIVTAVTLAVTNLDKTYAVLSGIASAFNAVFNTDIGAGNVLTALAAVATMLLLVRTRAFQAAAIMSAVLVPAAGIAAILGLTAAGLDKQTHDSDLDPLIKKVKELDEEFKNLGLSQDSDAYKKRFKDIQDEFNKVDGKTWKDRLKKTFEGFFSETKSDTQNTANSTVSSWDSAATSIIDKYSSLSKASSAATSNITKQWQDTSKSIKESTSSLTGEALFAKVAGRGSVDKPIITPEQEVAQIEASRNKIITGPFKKVPTPFTDVLEKKPAEAVKDALAPVEKVTLAVDGLSKSFNELPSLVAPGFDAIVVAAEAAATGVIVQMDKIIASTKEASKGVAATTPVNAGPVASSNTQLSGGKSIAKELSDSLPEIVVDLKAPIRPLLDLGKAISEFLRNLGGPPVLGSPPTPPQQRDARGRFIPGDAAAKTGTRVGGGVAVVELAAELVSALRESLLKGQLQIPAQIPGASGPKGQFPDILNTPNPLPGLLESIKKLLDRINPITPASAEPSPNQPSEVSPAESNALDDIKDSSTAAEGLLNDIKSTIQSIKTTLDSDFKTSLKDISSVLKEKLQLISGLLILIATGKQPSGEEGTRVPTTSELPDNSARQDGTVSAELERIADEKLTIPLGRGSTRTPIKDEVIPVKIIKNEASANTSEKTIQERIDEGFSTIHLPTLPEASRLESYDPKWLDESSATLKKITSGLNVIPDNWNKFLNAHTSKNVEDFSGTEGGTVGGDIAATELVKLIKQNLSGGNLQHELGVPGLNIFKAEIEKITDTELARFEAAENKKSPQQRIDETFKAPGVNPALPQTPAAVPAFEQTQLPQSFSLIVTGANSVAQAFEQAVQRITQAISTLPAGGTTAAGAAPQQGQIPQGDVTGITAAFQALQPIIQQTAQAGEQFKTALQGLDGGPIEALVEAYNRLTESINKAAEASSRVKAPSSSSNSGQAGYASGGIVAGPGTTTSDSVTIRVSNKEGILNAKAVSFYGEGAVHNMNALRLPRFAMGGVIDTFEMPRFSDGGLVNEPFLPSRGSGPSSSDVKMLHPVNMNYNGKSTRGYASPGVVKMVDHLSREATDTQMASLGPAPTWSGR